MNRPLDLGSWTMLADIGGQVSESPANPVVTVAAVALRGETQDSVRRKLINRFAAEPVKWKRGGLPGLRHVTQLCSTYSARVLVVQVHRESDRWRRFYEQASRQKPGSVREGRWHTLMGTRS
jgi:hypothetical protein